MKAFCPRFRKLKRLAMTRSNSEEPDKLLPGYAHVLLMAAPIHEHANIMMHLNRLDLFVLMTLDGKVSNMHTASMTE